MNLFVFVLVEAHGNIKAILTAAYFRRQYITVTYRTEVPDPALEIDRMLIVSANPRRGRVTRGTHI